MEKLASLSKTCLPTGSAFPLGFHKMTLSPYKAMGYSYVKSRQLRISLADSTL